MSTRVPDFEIVDALLARRTDHQLRWWTMQWLGRRDGKERVLMFRALRRLRSGSFESSPRIYVMPNPGREGRWHAWLTPGHRPVLLASGPLATVAEQLEQRFGRLASPPPPPPTPKRRGHRD